jgi:mannosylglycerate hydrolase
MKKKTAHIISTTHWDREWYWSQEKFRIRLVDLMDSLIEIFETNPNYKYYTLDGQVIALDDYLEVRPENRPIVEKLIKDGKLWIGPWYVLPDVFLVSGESIVRNLLIGFNDAKKYGNVMKAGYLPDSFSHIDQIPQIMNGFGLKDYLFMRGMGKQYESIGSEFFWKTPDGSKVFTTYLAEGYFSAGGLGFPDAFMDFKDLIPDFNLAFAKMKEMMEKYASIYKGDHYLLFNGSDHTTPQKELPDMIEFLNKKFDHIHFKHSTIREYLDSAFSESREYPVYQGEFSGNIHHLIVRGVYSSRMYLKQLNCYSQALLEKYAEPVSTLLLTEGKKDYHPNIVYAWKQLMQNHPHDDISGCSVDEVHRSMVNRNEKVNQVGEFVFEKGLKTFAKNIQTNSDFGDPFIVYNPLNWQRKEVIRAKVPLNENYKGVQNFILRDSKGKIIPMKVIDCSINYYTEINTWKYLPTIDIEFIGDIPSFGYAIYYISADITKEFTPLVKVGKNSLENEFYKINVAKNGSLVIWDKMTGVKYKDFNIFEDTEDDGDEYNYSFVEKSLTITTKDSFADISVYEKSGLSGTFKIDIELKLPECLHESRTKRSKKMVKNFITTFVTLRAGSKRIDIRTEFENNSKDHRFRVLFPSKFSDYKNYADGHYNVVKREKYFEPIPTERGKVEYFATQHQSNFVTLTDGTNGVTIANKGLPEYEIFKDSTIAITLLRCVGFINKNNLMTRWRLAGPDIATPEAQCLGKNIFEYSVILHKKSWENAYKESYNFIYPVKTFDIENSSGELSAVQSILSIEPESLILTAFKKAEDSNGIIIRFFNIKDNDILGVLEFYKPIKKCMLTNMLEENIEEYEVFDGNKIKLSVTKNKIITLRIIC